MTFFRVWKTTFPLGTNESNTASREIRNIRHDVDERIDSLGIAFSDDPIVGTNLKYDYFSWCAWNWSGETNITLSSPSGSGINLGNSTQHNIFCPINIPRGCIITTLDVQSSIGNGSAGSVGYMRLKYVDCTGGSAAITTIESFLLSSGAGAVNDEFTLATPHTIDTTATNYKYYYLELDVLNAAAASTFFGARLGYKTPPLFW